MPNPSRLQPLTLSHVNRQEEIWSSDSDSGITVDSHSPPSKITPDSGICADQLPWNLPPPPPSLLSDDTPGCSMTSKAAPTTRAAMPVTSPEESEAERQRKQDYVRNTLLEYERQKMLEEERDGNFRSKDNVDVDRSRGSPIYANQVNDLPNLSSPAGSDRLRDPASQGMANDYVPSQMIQKSRHPNHEQGDVTDSHLHVTYQDLNDRFAAGEFFPPGDEGYGTDCRSNTTGSLASPLSSSLSSLTTDSSSSLNGSQRGVGPLSGNGSTRAQPVASSGRLVIGKRGMLVKRRDLPVVERTDTVTLEDRLRALTTIQEEDSAASTTNPNSTSQSASPSNPRKETTDKWARSQSAIQGSGSVSSDGQTYPEGLYSVISKRPSQLRTAGCSRPVPRPRTGGGGGEKLCGDSGDSNSSSLHRALPVRIQPERDRDTYLSSTETGPGDGPAERSASADEKRGGDDSYTQSGSGEGKSEVRFKAGGGGVKLNDSGQFEIDYSYYMKASPSESNDELNTYSPTSTHTQFGEAFREGDSMPPRRRSTPRSQQTQSLPDEDSRYSRRSDLNLHIHRDYPKSGSDSEDQSRYFGSGPQDYEPEETEHVYMNVGVYDPPSRPGSLPNLNVHVPLHHRRHSGDSCHQESVRHSQDSGPPQSILRRNHAPGSGYPNARQTGQGDRNSCDVGSLYRQTDLSQTFPPSQGVVADRLSLNMGDLPRIHEQLRATSEMLLSSGKRHQFASSSDIYKLFQGQQNQGASFGQGRQPPHRRSFHDFTASPPLHNLAEVRSRVKANASSSNNQSQTAASPRLSSGPLRANHNIFVPESVGYSGYGSGRDHVGVGASRQVYSRDLDAPPGGEREGVTLRDRLDRGQQFSTDVIQSEEGEQLSTLV